MTVDSVLPFKSGMTLAVSASFGVDAEVFALHGLLGALVHVVTSLPVGSKKHSFRTKTEYLKSKIIGEKYNINCSTKFRGNP